MASYDENYSGCMAVNSGGFADRGTHSEKGPLPMGQPHLVYQYMQMESLEGSGMD